MLGTAGSRQIRGCRNGVGLALVLAIVLALAAAPEASALPARPNILFIVTDDQRAADTMEVMPSTRYWFENRGTKFPHAVATTPLCCPARSSIMTGRYVHNTGVQANPEGDHLDHSKTIQRYLQDEGYETGIFGKLLNSWRSLQNPPYWDSWAVGPSGYLPYLVNDNGRVRSVSTYSTDFLRDKAVGFLRRTERTDSRPWFMYVTPIAPHAPFTPAARHADASVPAYDPNPAFYERNGAPNDLSDKPERVRLLQDPDPAAFDEFILGDPFDPVGSPGMRVQQLRSLMAVDDMVSKIFSTLVANGEEQKTLAIFISDNGVMWGEHGLRGKGWPYRDSQSIPFYVHAPGEAAVPPGGVDDAIAANVDLVPTALDAVGISPPDPVDGMSLLDAGANRDRILLEYWGDNQNFSWSSLLTRDLQYTEHYRQNGSGLRLDENGDPVLEYYDLNADPWQLDNLLGDGNPGNDPVTTGLSAQLAQDRLCTGNSALPPGCPPGPGAVPAVDQTPPKVKLTLPLNGALVRGVVPVTAEAWDNLAIAGVQFKVGTQPIAPEDTIGPFSPSGGWNSSSALVFETHRVSAEARDAAGNKATASATVGILDTDIQANNGNGLVGEGDTITYTFPSPVNPSTILTGWSGLVPQTVNVRLQKEGTPDAEQNDLVTVTGTNTNALGSISLGRFDYATEGAGITDFPSSTMTMPDSRTVRVELHGASIPTTGTGTGAMRWTPGTATNTQGVQFCSCLVLESGWPLDREF